MLKSFDTNIALYAFVDVREPAKTTVARALLQELHVRGEGLISLQVLREFSNVCTKRLRPYSSQALLLAHLEVLNAFHPVEVPASAIQSAVETHYRYKISFWDALIIEAARQGGAELLYSQDLQHGMKFDGLQVVNPFL